MSEEKRENPKQEEEKKEHGPISETWAQDALTDLDDWIEEQGIYIRQ